MSVTHAITRPLSAGYGGIDFCDGCEVRLASGEWPSELCASCCDSLAARQMAPHRVKRVPAQAKKRQGTRIDVRDNVPSSDGQRRPENPSRDHAAAVVGALGKTLSAARNHGRHDGIGVGRFLCLEAARALLEATWYAVTTVPAPSARPP